VLDLHDLVAAHVTRLDQAERALASRLVKRWRAAPR